MVQVKDLCPLSQEETLYLEHYPTKAQKVVAVTRGCSQASGIEQRLPHQTEVSFSTCKLALCVHLQLPPSHLFPALVPQAILNTRWLLPETGLCFES